MIQQFFFQSWLSENSVEFSSKYRCLAPQFIYHCHQRFRVDLILAQSNEHGQTFLVKSTIEQLRNFKRSCETKSIYKGFVLSASPNKKIGRLQVPWRTVKGIFDLPHVGCSDSRQFAANDFDFAANAHVAKGTRTPEVHVQYTYNNTTCTCTVPS